MAEVWKDSFLGLVKQMENTKHADRASPQEGGTVGMDPEAVAKYFHEQVADPEETAQIDNWAESLGIER